MGRRSSAEVALPSPVPSRKSVLQALRATLAVAGAVLAAICFVVFYLKAEQFLITDSRFSLPDDALEIENTHFASEAQIGEVFSRDFGRSIYLCPISERRRRLLAIDWVKDATVLRIWPNRIIVRIKEREPVAFVQLPERAGTMGYRLIDSDGVFLDPQHAIKLKLPVLSGVPLNEAREKRAVRLKRFLVLQSELGATMEKVSEVDVSEVDNLKITGLFEGRALTLLLGNRKFEERTRNFLESYPEIRRRIPEATVFDLRLKDRITAAGGPAR